MNRRTAPAPLEHAGPRPWVFLAGAIDPPGPGRWRERVAAALAHQPGTLLDPTRDDWDGTWGRDLDDPRLAVQVAWELDALERADLAACWLPATGPTPVSLLELGLHARGDRLVAACAPGHPHRGHVRAVCTRHRVPLVDTLEDLTDLLRQRLPALETP